MRNLKFGLVGAGGIAQAYAQAFNESECCKLVAVADLRKDAAEALAEIVGGKAYNDYRQLAELRHQIRRFLQFSENAARACGLEPRQHQLLLTVKGLPEGIEPTIGAIAKRLFLRHHTTVELVDRLVKIDAVQRERGLRDAREVKIRLTPKGEAILRDLAIVHRREIGFSGPEVAAALLDLIGNGVTAREPAARAE